MRSQDSERGSVAEREGETGIRENDSEVCRKLPKEAKQVVKSESLRSTFKGDLDVREERQTMI